MGPAYVDSSAIVAIGLGEDGWESLSDRVFEHDTVASADLIEAEVRATFLREGVSSPAALLERIERIHPQRRLSAEISRVLEAGNLKGADAWHLAVALSIVDDPGELTFLTLDERQRTVAAALGFRT